MSESQQVTTGQVKIRTVLSDDGTPSVGLHMYNVEAFLTPDAALTIALSLLSAAYASRGEQAAFKYAIDNNIDPTILIKYIRELK